MSYPNPIPIGFAVSMSTPSNIVFEEDLISSVVNIRFIVNDGEEVLMDF